MKDYLGIIAGTVLLCVVLCGVFFLAYKHIVSGGEAMTVVTAVVGIAGGAFAVHAGVNAGASAATPSSTTTTTPDLTTTTTNKETA